MSYICFGRAGTKGIVVIFGIVLNWIIYLNLIVSVSAGMLSWGFANRMGLENGLCYGIFVLLGTLSVYNAQRLFKVRGSKQLTPWLSWVKDHFTFVLILSLLSGAGTAMVLISLKPFSLIPVFILLSVFFMGIFYVVRIGENNLRSIPFLKIHVIALSWALLLILFPLVNEEQATSLIAVSAAHYLYILAVTIPFDIRDLQYDDQQYKTIPQVLGINGSKALALGALIGYVLLIGTIFPELHSSMWFWCANLLTVGLILGAKKEISDWYYAGLIDGSISLVGLVYLLA